MGSVRVSTCTFSGSRCCVLMGTQTRTAALCFGGCHSGNVQNTLGVATASECKSRASNLAERCCHRRRRVVVVGGTCGTTLRCRAWVAAVPSDVPDLFATTRSGFFLFLIIVIFGKGQKMCLRTPPKRSGTRCPESGLKCVFCLPSSGAFSVFFLSSPEIFSWNLGGAQRMRTTQNVAVGDEERDLLGSCGARGKPEGNRIQIQIRFVIFSKVKNHTLLL